MGYNFKPIEAIIFKECKPFLKQYVEEFTKVKDRGGAYRSIGKLFINSLYGRFGLNSKDKLTIIIPKEREEHYAHRFYITDRVEIDSNLYLPTELLHGAWLFVSFLSLITENHVKIHSFSIHHFHHSVTTNLACLRIIVNACVIL